MRGALREGLSLVSGLHQRLVDIPALASEAMARNLALIDVRVPPGEIAIATGETRTGKRLLTVGTDCCVGKKYTALALARALTDEGMKATFRATGQTGIMISGQGIPMDAVISDFLSGAAEQLSPNADHDHWDIIEGQGSLFHPAPTQRSRSDCCMAVSPMRSYSATMLAGRRSMSMRPFPYRISKPAFAAMRRPLN